MRRLREALVKLVCVAGVCKPLEAIMDIDAAARPEDKDYSFSRFVDLTFRFYGRGYLIRQLQGRVAMR